jgi:hypothetical protein
MAATGRATAVSAASDIFNSERLEQVFNHCFMQQLGTRLVGGADEPFYQPASEASQLHSLYYRSDYFASALHEAAHWCIAGEQRRQLVDFGYWYAPEGRSVTQQQAFEAVECKPQALEWFFSRACGYRFQVSADNLDLVQAGLLESTVFQSSVLEQALHWQQVGLPERADTLFRGLCREFGTTVAPEQLHFSLADLI